MMRVNMAILRTISVIVIFLGTLEHTVAQDIRKVKMTELVRLIDESKHPMVINFWATYCRPCLEEIPHLQKLTTQFKADSIRLLLVSLDLQEDYPESLNAFVKKRNITAPVIWLDEHNADYFCPLIDEKWSGALPATLFINNKTAYRKFSEKAFHLAELETEYRALLGR